MVEERSDHVTGSVGAGQDADIADIVRQAEDGMGSTKPSRGAGLVVRGDDAVDALERLESALAVGRGDPGGRGLPGRWTSVLPSVLRDRVTVWPA
ncbi:hypothetical protein [Gluconobacter sphaericus]|uniref:hypothetical protein n=1 Tax=Gluconobacter sphaericus TaxID=574987 RepID=UPI00312BC39E